MLQKSSQHAEQIDLEKKGFFWFVCLFLNSISLHTYQASCESDSKEIIIIDHYFSVYTCILTHTHSRLPSNSKSVQS